MTSDLPGAGLLLSIIARSAFILVAKALVLATPPTSGDTQISFFEFNFFFIYFAKRGAVYKLSTGISKNPCICPACKSTVTTLVAPALEIKFATTLAEIDVLGATFLSCLAYPKYGITAVIVFADDLFIYFNVNFSVSKSPYVCIYQFEFKIL